VVVVSALVYLLIVIVFEGFFIFLDLSVIVRVVVRRLNVAEGVVERVEVL